MRSTKIIKNSSSSLCTCLHHMVILRTRNKITDFLMILAWASPFKPFEPNKIVRQKSQPSATRLGYLCWVNIHFCVAVTKIAKCVMIAHSLCAVPAHWAMVTQINCAIVGDRVYSVQLAYLVRIYGSTQGRCPWKWLMHVIWLVSRASSMAF